MLGSNPGRVTGIPRLHCSAQQGRYCLELLAQCLQVILAEAITNVVPIGVLRHLRVDQLLHLRVVNVDGCQ